MDIGSVTGTLSRIQRLAKWMYLQKGIKGYYYFKKTKTQAEENTSQEFRPEYIRKSFYGAEEKSQYAQQQCDHY